MQIADPRQMTGTKRRLIMRDAASMGQGMALSLEDVNMLALRYQLPEIEVRGLLVACGYRIPEPTVQPRTDQDPVKKADRLAALVAAAKPPVPAEVIAGILQGSIYKQLGEGDGAYVVTTKAAFLRERAALRQIFKDNKLT